MKKRPRIAVFGSVHMDLIAYADVLPEKARSGMARGFSMGLGGKGGNQALECAAAGAEVFMVTQFGDDAFGKSLLASLTSHGVNCAAVATAGGLQTGASTVLSSPEGYTSLIFPGAAAAMTPEAVVARIAALGPLDMLLVQLELPSALSVAAARTAKAMGAMVVVNASPPSASLSNFLQLVDLLVVNEVEAEALIGKADPIRLAKHIGGRAVITLGAKGSVASDGQEVWRNEAERVAVRSTVGAGDAFLAGLCVAFCRGNDLDEALRLASKAAARKISGSKIATAPD